MAILWPVKAIFEKRAATVEVDTFISPVVIHYLCIAVVFYYGVVLWACVGFPSFSPSDLSFSLRSCRSLSVIFFDFGDGNLAGILRDFFPTHKLKAQKIGKIFGAFYKRKFVAQEKIVPTSFCRRATLIYPLLCFSAIHLLLARRL